MINRLCIIGVGLIGGSLSRALREKGFCRHVIGCGRDERHLQRACQLGVINEYSTDPANAVQGADMIVVSVPLRAMQSVFEQIDPHVSVDAVLTDVGSAKACVETAARKTLSGSLDRFVPGHPIAGTEHSGVEASFAELYQGRKVILTPLQENTRETIGRVKAMWEATGANVQQMTAAHHDEVLAETSHLPHVLAFALVDTLSHMGDSDEVFQYAAGGFRDFTRIASSDPVMWRDICMENRDAILKILDRYMSDLENLREVISKGDLEMLQQIFSRAKDARDKYTQKYSS